MKHVEAHSRNLRKGILYMLASALFSTLVFLVSKAVQKQTSVSVMVFFRSWVGAFCLLPWMWAHRDHSFRIVSVKTVWIRSLSVLFNVVLIFQALKSISLVDLTLLSNTAPIFVPLLVWVWMRAPIPHRLWPAIFIGLIGVACILRPDQALLRIGAIFGVLSGVCTAISLISVRLMTAQEKIYTAVFYPYAIGALLSAPFAWAFWELGSWDVFAFLCLLGLFSVFSQWLMFRSLYHASSSQVAPFGYFAVVYAVCYDWLFFAEIPPWLTVLGILLVVIGGVWILHTGLPAGKRR